MHPRFGAGLGPSNWKITRGLALVFLLVLLPAQGEGQAPPPDERWMTFRTDHFEVVFPERLTELAERAAERGERALTRLEGFGARPTQRIQLVLTDHVDLSNGFARSAPYPRIVLWARPPLDGPAPIPFDDWLELVVTHEVVHILHLELTSPVGQAARRVLGRAPLAWPHFPAFVLSSWALEGIAVASESALTDGGRIHGARFEATLRALLLEGRGDGLAQAMGSSPLFPGGERPYALGGLFFHELGESEGTEAVHQFFRRQGTRLNPLRLEAGAREVFGRSLSELHSEWMTKARIQTLALVQEVEARALAPIPEPLQAKGGRMALYPAFRPSDGALVWTEADGRSEPSLWIRPGGPLDSGEADRAVLPLHMGTPPIFAPDGTLWLAQPEYQDRYRIHSDLWRVELPAAGSRGGARKTRITRGLRVSTFDLHPIHPIFAAVLEGEGTQRVVLLEGTGGGVIETLLPADPGVHWMHPRWSPNGQDLALLRWEAGGMTSVVVLQGIGERAAARASAGSRETSPSTVPNPGPPLVVVTRGPWPLAGVAWAPEGESLLFSSERSGIANLYEAPVRADAPLRQLTDLVTAGIYPVPTPDGRVVVFSHLTAEGWRLARIPRTEGFEPLPPEVRFPDGGEGPMVEGYRATRTGPIRPWSPAPTLRPQHWLPRFQGAATLGGDRALAPTLGLESFAEDALGRNRWDLLLDLPLSGPGRRWEGRGSWSWAGLGNPVLSGTGEQRWEALARVAPPEGAPDPDRPLILALRERSGAVGASVVRPGFRSIRQLSVALRGVEETLAVLEPGGETSDRARLRRPERQFLEGSLILSHSTLRSYAFHPSTQEGQALTLRLRSRSELSLPDSLRGVQGFDGARRDALLLGRAFFPLPLALEGAGGAPVVLALRGAVGVAGGPGAGLGTFRVGGGGGGGTRLFGATWDRVPGAFQVRGFEAGVRGGSRAWGGGAELRLPLALVHRGTRAFPGYLDRVAVGGWVDAGGATLPNQAGNAELISGTGSDTLLSAGAEVVLLQSLLTWTPFALRVGGAVPLRGVVPGGGGGALAVPGPSLYAGIGWSF